MIATHIVKSTVRQILGIRRVLLFGSLLLFPSVVLLLRSGSVSGRRLLSSFVEIGTEGLFVVAIPITALILSASALGTERRDQTLSFVVLRPIPRAAIAGAKLFSAFAAALILNLGAALTLSVIFGAQESEWGYVLPILVGTTIATAVYAAIFVPLGYFTERSTLIGLAFIFVWEAGIVGPLEALGVTSPWRIGYAAFVALSPDAMLDHVEDFSLANLSPDIATSLIQLAVYVGLSLGLLTWIFRTRDLA